MTRPSAPLSRPTALPFARGAWVIPLAAALVACPGEEPGSFPEGTPTATPAPTPTRVGGPTPTQPGGDTPTQPGEGTPTEATEGTPSATPSGVTPAPVSLSYPIVDTGQTRCYSDTAEASCPAQGATRYGQDAQYAGNPPSYKDNGDGTVTDLVTSLTWEQGLSDKMAYSAAAGYCASLSLAGAIDWRLPTTKELYSLILYSGSTGVANPSDTTAPGDAVPYIDTDAFGFAYGGGSAGARYIDAQWATSTLYVSKVFLDDAEVESGKEAFFGVNFADGRIKGYPTSGSGTWRVRCVLEDGRGYGVNDFGDGGDATITDHATGLMWMQEDSGHAGAGDLGDGTLSWSQALAFCEDLSLAGHSDWRLPNAKELHSLMDYTRSPDTTASAALDPLFKATAITAEDDSDNFGWYWTSTTHLDGAQQGADAIYMAFGEALGYTRGPDTQLEMFLDVHGAGAQRGDPKAGSRGDFPVWGGGPQGDVRRVFNFARCVRDAG